MRKKNAIAKIGKDVVTYGDSAEENGRRVVSAKPRRVAGEGPSARGPPTLDHPLLTTAETAAILRIPKNTLEKWRVFGSGPRFTKLAHSCAISQATSPRISPSRRAPRRRRRCRRQHRAVSLRSRRPPAAEGAQNKLAGNEKAGHFAEGGVRPDRKPRSPPWKDGSTCGQIAYPTLHGKTGHRSPSSPSS